jgi:DNA-binding winged helix-turn-helix (wHTH) protein
MSLMEKEMYEFGAFSLDSAERVLSRDGTSLTLTPKVFDTLLCLVRNRGRLLTKDELLKEIWPDTFVEEVNLAVKISTLRKALGENPQDGRHIVTVPGHGYRFVADVREVSNEDEAEQKPVAASPAEFELEGPKPNGVGSKSQRNSQLSIDSEAPKHELVRSRAKTNGVGSLLVDALYFRETPQPNASDAHSCRTLAVRNRCRLPPV